MGRILLAIVLGLFAPVVAFMAGSAVEIPGQNPPQEMIAASLAAFLYLAICQFLVARRDARRAAANWPTMVALGVPLLLMASVADARDLAERVRQDGPIVLAGWLGIFAGAWAAGCVTLSPLTLESCRRNLRACAAVLAAVAVVLAAAVIPLSRNAGTFPDGSPGETASVFWWIVGVSVLVAAGLALVAARAGHGRRPSFAVLGFLALLAFAPAFFLAIPAIWLVGHGPLLRAVSIISPACSLAQLAVAVLLGATALRLPEAQTT